MNEFNIRPALPEEHKLFYCGDTRHVGHMRADFDATGIGFFHTWWEGPAAAHNNQEFKAEFDSLIGSLRKEYLKDLKSMEKHCWKHSELRIPGGYRQMFGVIAESEKHLFAIRMTPYLGEYQVYAFGFIKEA